MNYDFLPVFWKSTQTQARFKSRFLVGILGIVLYNLLVYYKYVIVCNLTRMMSFEGEIHLINKNTGVSYFVRQPASKINDTAALRWASKLIKTEMIDCVRIAPGYDLPAHRSCFDGSIDCDITGNFV